jgi:hypothetical protein
VSSSFSSESSSFWHGSRNWHQRYQKLTPEISHHTWYTISQKDLIHTDTWTKTWTNTPSHEKIRSNVFSPAITPITSPSPPKRRRHNATSKIIIFQLLFPYVDVDTRGSLLGIFGVIVFIYYIGGCHYDVLNITSTVSWYIVVHDTAVYVVIYVLVLLHYLSHWRVPLRCINHHWHSFEVYLDQW